MSGTSGQYRFRGSHHDPFGRKSLIFRTDHGAADGTKVHARLGEPASHGPGDLLRSPAAARGSVPCRLLPHVRDDLDRSGRLVSFRPTRALRTRIARTAGSHIAASARHRVVLALQSAFQLAGSEIGCLSLRAWLAGKSEPAVAAQAGVVGATSAGPVGPRQLRTRSPRRPDEAGRLGYTWGPVGAMPAGLVT